MFAGHDAVINLVGILNETRRQTFARVHAELPAKIVRAAIAARVPRLLHMSALHAKPDAPSAYLRTKAAGEAVVLAAESTTAPSLARGPRLDPIGESDALHVTVFHPSVIFGEGDSFTNRFARLLRLTPGVFPLACPEARFQPVYVGDVADAYVHALGSVATHGRAYDLCGPRRYTLRELVVYVALLGGHRTRIVGLPDWAARLQARVLELAPGKPFTYDNYLSLQVDSVCDAGFPPEFGIIPRALEDLAPAWLERQTA